MASGQGLAAALPSLASAPPLCAATGTSHLPASVQRPIRNPVPPGKAACAGPRIAVKGCAEHPEYKKSPNRGDGRGKDFGVVGSAGASR